MTDTTASASATDDSLLIEALLAVLIGFTVIALGLSWLAPGQFWLLSMAMPVLAAIATLAFVIIRGLHLGVSFLARLYRAPSSQ